MANQSSPLQDLQNQMIPVQTNPAPQQPTNVYNLISGTKHDLYDDSFTLCSVYKAAALLTATSPVLAVVPALLLTLEWGIGGLVLMALQLLFVVSILLHKDRYRGLNCTRCALLGYFALLACAMVACEAWSLYYKVKNNGDHCGEFEMYSVCHKRGGVMTTELLMAIFYPGADIFAFICMSYANKSLKLRCEGVRIAYEQQIWEETQGNRPLI